MSKYIFNVDSIRNSFDFSINTIIFFQLSMKKIHKIRFLLRQTTRKRNGYLEFFGAVVALLVVSQKRYFLNIYLRYLNKSKAI
jgi:hypothetical protein